MCLCLQTENHFVVVTENNTAKRSSEGDHFVKGWGNPVYKSYVGLREIKGIRMDQKVGGKVTSRGHNYTV